MLLLCLAIAIACTFTNSRQVSGVWKAKLVKDPVEVTLENCNHIALDDFEKINKEFVVGNISAWLMLHVQRL